MHTSLAGPRRRRRHGSLRHGRQPNRPVRQLDARQHVARRQRRAGREAHDGHARRHALDVHRRRPRRRGDGAEPAVLARRRVRRLLVVLGSIQSALDARAQQLFLLRGRGRPVRHVREDPVADLARRDAVGPHGDLGRRERSRDQLHVRELAWLFCLAAARSGRRHRRRRRRRGHDLGRRHRVRFGGVGQHEVARARPELDGRPVLERHRLALAPERAVDHDAVLAVAVEAPAAVVARLPRDRRVPPRHGLAVARAEERGLFRGVVRARAADEDRRTRDVDVQRRQVLVRLVVGV
mmetsp:Transcript_19062/g.56507  ORF Transcript_19062/g.56507 Transcript_19062/m.56507 type:complete len:295 (+) Transcript_19062:12-896(+)